MGSPGLAFWIGDESGSALGGRPSLPLFDCGYLETSLIWLLPGRGVPCHNCNIPGMISWHSTLSTNVVSAGAAAPSCICGSMTAVNPQMNSAVHLISFMEVVGCVRPSWLCQFVKLHLLQLKQLHVLLHQFGDCAHHPAGIVIFAQLAQLCIFIILIFPILDMLDLARSVRLSPRATITSWNVFSSSVVVNCTLSAFLVSSCSCCFAVSASSTRFLATAVSLST